MNRENIIVRGNGNYISGYAVKHSHRNGYKSMWLFDPAPIIKSDRRYLLIENEYGLLTVYRES